VVDNEALHIEAGADFHDIDADGDPDIVFGGDGKLDIVGGCRWFKHNGGTNYTPNIIDAGYAFTRSTAGQLIKGGRPEIILVVGDGWAPMMMYEWKKGVWVGKKLIEDIDCGHSLALIDFDGDGDYDILGKPYGWETPRSDIWLNESK